MDSDISLLEIAGEDDSLLQIPRDDSGVNNTSTIFSCSPLQCLRSVPAPAPQTEGRVGAVGGFEKLSHSPEDGISNENINGNKSEALRLNVEPQQMKRKKKGGGYNLRKSLAWDRAFFTEEGVLNPLELSMISGNRSTTNNVLTVIHEEENALEGEGDIVGASSVLQEIEENLFKQLPEDRNIGACLSPVSDASTKDTSASASLAKRKVLAVNTINRNRSERDACPRLTASSSPDPVKAQSKESKVSKIPVLKTHVPVITTTARSGASSTGYSKRNQNTHSAAYVQKNAGVKGRSKNLKSVPINAKLDVAGKCSVTRTLKRQAGKDIDDSISETHLPPRLKHQLVTEANKGFEVHPPLRICNTGNKKQPTQLQTAKPSGLRMPSPSLGFFSQPKASSSHSILHQSSKLCKPAESNIPKSKKVVPNCVNEVRCPHSPGKGSEIVNSEAKNCTPNLSLADVKSGASLQIENNQKAKVEMQCYSLGSAEIAEQEKVGTIPKHLDNKSLKQVGLYKSENVVLMENMEFHTNDKNLLLESDMDDHLKTKVDEPQSEEPRSLCYSSMQKTLVGRDDLSNIAQNAIEHEVDVQMKPPVCDAQISNKCLVPQAESGTSSKNSRHSGEFKEYNCIKIAQVNSNLGDFSETMLCVSLEGIPYKFIQGIKDGVGEHGVNANLPTHCNDTTQLISDVANQQLQYFHGLDGGDKEQSETMNASVVGELNLKSDCESHKNGCLVHATILSSQESPKKPLLEAIDACESTSKIAEMEDCKHTGDVQSASVHRRSDDNEYDQLIDSKLIQYRTKANSKLNKMCEDYLSQMEQADCSSRGSDMPVNNNSRTIDGLQFRDDCSSNESLKLVVADNLMPHTRIPHSSEAVSLKRKSLSEEGENSTSGKDEISNANAHNQIAEDSGEIFHLVLNGTKKSGTKRKQDVPTVIPPPNAAPFSDEWLAAMEAAGEEILTMKSGAVQNSPTDKRQHERGPWSPVRRKNQAIGPYDCTKYSNMNIPDSC